MTATTPEKSPSIAGVYFCAVLMALLGALLGFVYMTSFPAQGYSSQQEYDTFIAGLEEPLPAAKPGDAYYIEGPILRSRTWQFKRTELLAEGAQTVKLTAGEINAWMSAKFRPGVAQVDAEEASLLIEPGVLNVAITEAGIIYLNMPATFTFFGIGRDCTLSARGVFEGSGVRFESVMVSSAKLPLPAWVGNRIYAVLSQGYQSTEEFQLIADVFARAESIEAVGGELVFNLR